MKTLLYIIYLQNCDQWWDAVRYLGLYGTGVSLPIVGYLGLYGAGVTLVIVRYLGLYETGVTLVIVGYLGKNIRLNLFDTCQTL